VNPESLAFSAAPDRALGRALRGAFDRSGKAVFVTTLLARAEHAGVGSSRAVLGRWTAGAVVALLVAAAVLALSLVLPAWAAALIVFGGVTVATGLLVLAMALKLRRIVVRMRTTIQAAKEDARWFRTRILRID